MPEPRRDFSSELIAAVAVVAVMAFALVFGILLTLSSNLNTGGGAGATTTAVGIEETIGVVVLPPSLTPTATFSPTSTPTDTPTATFTFTDTSSNTPTDTPTDTPTYTATSTSTDTVTATYTATSTKAATYTPTPTNTPVEEITKLAVTITSSATKTIIPAEATPTATLTRTLAATPTAIYTPTTEIVVTATYTATLKPSSTSIPPTSTPTITVMPTDTATFEPEGTIPACSRPSGWVVYLMQPGDTLATIAEAVESTVQQLGRVNCITNPDYLLVGDVLFVPKLPEGAPDASEDVLMGCAAPEMAMFTKPEPGAELDGLIKLHGTATTGDTNFGYYRIEVRPDEARFFEFYLRSNLSMVDSELGTLNPVVFTSGRHWLRLVVVRRDGTIPAEGICVIPVNFK